jgi:hypothetical protein
MCMAFRRITLGYITPLERSMTFKPLDSVFMIVYIN